MDWFSDTFFLKVILLQGYSCAQIFTSGCFTTVHPLSLKSKVSQTLMEFSDNVGIPETLETKWCIWNSWTMKSVFESDCPTEIWLWRSEVGQSNQNMLLTDGEIGCQRGKCSIVFPEARNNELPLSSWLVTKCLIPSWNGWTLSSMTVHVWFYDHNTMEVAETGIRLARWIGVANRLGSDNSCLLLVVDGEWSKPLTHKWLHNMTVEDLLNEDVRTQVDHFDKAVWWVLEEEGLPCPECSRCRWRYQCGYYVSECQAHVWHRNWWQSLG